MKKIILIILSAILLIAAGLFYYSNHIEEKVINNEKQSVIEEAAKKDVREVVWDQLPAGQKDAIDGTWEDGKVSKIILNEQSVMSPVGDRSYAGEEVYLISFPGKHTATLGDLVVYADVNTFNIIGYGLRD